MSSDEYAVLECLVTAQDEGETPIYIMNLWYDWELVQDAAKDVHELSLVLDRLRELNLAGQDFQGAWIPTKHGVDVYYFREITARESD